MIYRRTLVIAFLILMISICSINIAIAQDDLDINKMLTKVDTNNMLLSDWYYIWGSSVVKGTDGKYHMFYSRWAHGKRKLDDDTLNYIFDGFSGWQKYSEVAYAVSDNLTGPYTHKGVILKGTGEAGRWDRFMMTNPQVRCFNGKYYLYYVSNSFNPNLTFKKEYNRTHLQWFRYNCTQHIGVVVADSPQDFLKGNFKTSKKPIMSPDGVTRIEIVNNPSVTQGPDGKDYMIFKSRITELGHMTMWMARSDYPDSAFTVISKVFTDPDMACEDPCIWYDYKRERFYAAVKYFSNKGTIISQFGGLALITSKNGTDWEVAKNPLISLRQLLMKDGRIQELANLERPFVYTDEKGQPLALFGAFSLKKQGSYKVEDYTPDCNTGNVGIKLEAVKK